MALEDSLCLRQGVFHNLDTGREHAHVVDVGVVEVCGFCTVLLAVGALILCHVEDGNATAVVKKTTLACKGKAPKPPLDGILTKVKRPTETHR